jgi:glycosyltransferase involved in cell wall biosynthesis
MIEGKRHGEALAMKADADLTFDSFWLGLQGSGLEAAAMGQMVIAGDNDVRALYVNSEVGECPYTYVRDRKQLTDAIEWAITDPDYRQREASRVNAYVTQYHDYAAVAKRYEQIIATVTGWRNVETERGEYAAA